MIIRYEEMTSSFGMWVSADLARQSEQQIRLLLGLRSERG